MNNILKPVSVRIQNFQSIKDINFKIDGFTCLVGVTNVGKSAIIRAISSALLNNSVIGMVRHGTSHSTVEMGCDSWSFKWEKGERGINRYTIGDKVLDKVGARQLDEIESFGFKSLDIGADEINPWLASQFFPIFLLDKPGSQVTDLISEVSRLNVLQNAIIISARGKRRSNDEFNSKLLESKEYQSKINRLSGLVDINEIEADLDAQLESIHEYDEKIKTVTAINNRLIQNANQIKSLNTISQVDVPDDIVKVEHGRYVLGVKTHVDINHIVMKIIPIKKASSVLVPDEVPEMSTYKDIIKFDWITEERESISHLEKVEDINVPGNCQDKIDDYVSLNRIEKKISNLQRSISQGSNVTVPDLILEYENFKEAESIQNKMSDEVSQLKNLAGILDQVHKDLGRMDEIINKIPLCPTCSRPHTSASHV